MFHRATAALPTRFTVTKVVLYYDLSASKHPTLCRALTLITPCLTMFSGDEARKRLSVVPVQEFNFLSPLLYQSDNRVTSATMDLPYPCHKLVWLDPLFLLVSIGWRYIRPCHKHTPSSGAERRWRPPLAAHLVCDLLTRSQAPRPTWMPVQVTTEWTV